MEWEELGWLTQEWVGPTRIEGQYRKRPMQVMRGSGITCMGKHPGGGRRKKGTRPGEGTPGTMEEASKCCNLLPMLCFEAQEWPASNSLWGPNW